MKRSKLSQFFKTNYEFILSIALLCIIFVVSFKPSKYVEASFVGLKVWATIVLPSLFFFFFVTKVLVQLKSSRKILSILDKPFNKIYKTNTNSGYIFLMSIISGYPVGAKLISEFYENDLITKQDAKKVISFCSSSGPMFILGSVAVKMFGNYKLGLVVLLSHTISTLLNGVIYSRIGTKSPLNLGKNTTYDKIVVQKNTSQKSLNDIMYDTIISIIMIGGYITLCFTLLEFIISLQGYHFILVLSEKLFGSNILDSIIKGIVELTNGCVSLSKSTCDFKTICIVLSSLISFGGLSIHLQSQMFLKKVGIKYSYFLLTKLTQTIITIFISALFSAILL